MLLIYLKRRIELFNISEPYKCWYLEPKNRFQLTLVHLIPRQNTVGLHIRFWIDSKRIFLEILLQRGEIEPPFPHQLYLVRFKNSRGN